MLSVVLPFWNQGDHVEKVLEEIIASLKSAGVRFELIPVVNGSTDHSFMVCQKVAKKHDNISPIELKTAGWGRAVNAGLAIARGDVLCYINTARSNPNDLLKMLEYAFQHPEVVVKADRVKRVGYPAFRTVASRIYNLECRILFGIRIHDIDGKPFIFPRKFNRLLTLRQPNILFDTELVAVCRKERYQIVEIPISTIPRISGTSTTTFRFALEMYLGVFRMWWDQFRVYHSQTRS